MPMIGAFISLCLGKNYSHVYENYISKILRRLDKVLKSGIRGTMEKLYLETWHRRADYMNEILAEIAKADLPLAKRIFSALNDCVGCYDNGCLAKTRYEFEGQKRLTCHGRVMLRMCHEDFQDAREFFSHLNVLLERKSMEGSLQTEKILLLVKA